MNKSTPTTVTEFALTDLESQFSVDERYAAKCRELALARAQYHQLFEFVKSKADILGLTEVPAGEPVTPEVPEGEPLTDESAAPAAGVASEKAPLTKAEPVKPPSNGKVILPKGVANPDA